MCNLTLIYTVVILSSSKVLALHFKRFTATNEKNKVKIPLTTSLSLSSLGLVSEDAEEVHDGTYHLCGIIHHDGNTVHEGHYTACAKRKLCGDDDDDDSAAENVEDQWVLFNDLRCNETTLDYATGNVSEFNQRNCYMAFYELKSAEQEERRHDAISLAEILSRCHK